MALRPCKAPCWPRNSATRKNTALLRLRVLALELTTPLSIRGGFFEPVRGSGVSRAKTNATYLSIWQTALFLQLSPTCHDAYQVPRIGYQDKHNSKVLYLVVGCADQQTSYKGLPSRQAIRTTAGSPGSCDLYTIPGIS